MKRCVAAVICDAFHAPHGPQQSCRIQFKCHVTCQLAIHGSALANDT